MKENYRRIACTKCEFNMSKTPGGRTFEMAEVEDLLKNRETPLLQGFRSKMGRPFAAILRIVDDAEAPAKMKMEFDFGQSRDDEEAPDFSGKTPVGKCPKCGGNVYDHGLSYYCENAVGPEKNCDFRSGQVILQQIIEPEQMSKLLTVGRTDLLTNFKSARTGRLFKAFLVWDKKAGKTVFEFEAKAPKKDAAAKTSKATAKDEGAAESTPAKAVKKPAAKAKTVTKAKAAPKAKASTAKATKAKKADAAPTDDAPPLSAYDDEPPF
jgi:DNA topoisomerase-3